MSITGNRVQKDTTYLDAINIKLDAPIASGDVTTHAAETAYEKVLDYCGASYHRDAVDARYMEEARTGTVHYTGAVSKRQGIVDVINDPNGTEDPTTVSFPILAEETRPEGYDTDGDGMPDAWEEANGLDKNNAEDSKLYTLDTEKGWYTNLEVYLNGIVEEITKAQNEGALNAVSEYYPLQKFTSLEQVLSPNAIERIEYYNLNGQPIAEPQQGISIRCIVFANGQKEVEKVLK